MSTSNKKLYWAGGLISVLLVAVLIRFALAIPAFDPALAPTGYIAQNEVSNFNLKSNSETLYRAEYEKEFYSGNMFAYAISANGDFNPAADLWTGGAAEHIDAQDFTTGRFIATMKDSGTGIGTGIPFEWASLSATQQGFLDNSSVLDFLRGDRSNEIQNGVGDFRQRGSALGDIVHSRAYYVADATNPTIFVGANDGMLHALDATPATGGDERWAYVPSMLLNKMKVLSDRPYVRDYFVDGQINIGKIASGKRILVGTLGGGGKGVYALDISSLTAASNADVAAKALWEIAPTTVNYAAPTTANAYVNLGYTYGTPVLAKVGGVDAVIIGNGYNNNAGGDYGSYLYVIKAADGQLIKKISAGTGTAANPNGIFTPAAIDTDADGSVDTAYAGDLNGTMWKFDLTAGTASALYVTSPAQPITIVPSLSVHPSGGFMVNFATGSMLTPTDATDTSVFYAYGIRDGGSGTNIVTQTQTERVFGSKKVRNATSIAMNWATDKGWKVALPAGERVVGEGSYVANQRYYFTASNPTKSQVVAGTSTTVYGETWLMELDFLSGGAKNQPFLDLSGDLLLNTLDRILYTATDKYIATDIYTTDDTLGAGEVLGATVLPARVGTVVNSGRVGKPILHAAGIPVGKFLDIGVSSQPILVNLVSLNDTLFSQSPDVQFPVITELVAGGRGVAGGHFDVDIYYNGAASTTGGTAATATITVGTTGQTTSVPATLGVISVNGVTVVPALTVTDITNGFATTTNATTLAAAVQGGFTATRVNNVITVTAPSVGSIYNGKAFTIEAGTSAAAVPARPALSQIIIGAQPTGIATRINDITFNGTSIMTSNPIGFNAGSSEASIAQNLAAVITPPAGYTESITTTFVPNDTITFTATTNGGAGQSAVVTSTAAAEIIGVTGYTVTPTTVAATAGVTGVTGYAAVPTTVASTAGVTGVTGYTTVPTTVSSVAGVTGVTGYATVPTTVSSSAGVTGVTAKVVTPTSVTSATGVATKAVSTIVMSATASPQSITAVTFGGASVLTGTANFATGKTAGQNATTLAALLTAPAGWTKAVSGANITFTQNTAATIAAQPFVITGSGSASVAATAGNSTTNAVSTIQITSAPAGESRITGVTFNAASILGSTVNFAAGQTASQIATTLSAALTDPAGWTHSASGDTITFTQTATGGAARPIVVSSSVQAAVTAVNANSTIQITSAPAGLSRINTVTFGGASVLGSTVNFAAGQTSSQLAATLAAALTPPAGWTETVSGDVITFTQNTAATIAAQPFVVTSTAQAAVTAVNAVSRITIGTAPAGLSRINNVTFGGPSVLGSTVNFAAGQTSSQLAATLAAGLTPPAGWTETVSGNVITFTQDTAATIAAQPFVVTSTAQAAVTAVNAVSRITIGTAPAGLSRINNVTFGGSSVVGGTVIFAAGQTSSQLAATLAAATTPPTGWTETASGNVITFTQDTAASIAAQPFAVTSTAQAAVTAVRANSTITIGNPGAGATRIQGVTFGGASVLASTVNFAAGQTASQIATTLAAALTPPAGWTATVAGNVITFTQDTAATITAQSFVVSGTVQTAVTAAPAYDVQPASPSFTSGNGAAGAWTDLKPALTVTTFSGGTDGTTTVAAGAACTKNDCASKNHVHEYDDKYDRTGVNYLDGSAGIHDLTQAIGVSSNAQFKVIIQNQYLSPAVQLHIGNPAYVYNVDKGYIDAKTYTTSATLSLASLPTYTLATIGSLAINMPIDAFQQRDWWNGYLGLPADVRVGLHPTQTGCVKTGKGSNDGNMFQPVIPPATVTASGNGTLGYNGSTTPATATGVRHNGAFTLQVISASTLDSEIELAVPGSPEYGWRLKSTVYHSRLLAEWTTFWHSDNPSKACYGETGWTKLAIADLRPCGAADVAANPSATPPVVGTQKCVAAVTDNLGSDPKIENFGVGCETTFTVTGNVETRVTVCDDGKEQKITKTRNNNGTTTIRVEYTPPTVPNDTDPKTASDVTRIIAADGGQTTSGGDERGLQPQTTRISWRELIRP